MSRSGGASATGSRIPRGLCVWTQNVAAGRFSGSNPDIVDQPGFAEPGGNKEPEGTV